MRRTIVTLGLLLPVVACSSDDGYSGRQASSTTGYNATTNTPAPVVPPQAGQAGQSSQQARTAVARESGSEQARSGTVGTTSTAGVTPGTATGGSATSGISGSAMQLSAAEQAFVMDAAQGGMAEVELGRLAQSRGGSAQVRDFGRMMVQQHTQANSELMTLAQRMGVTPPTSLSPSAQAAQMRLQQAQGRDFDRQYVEQQAAAHLEQRTLFQFTANNAQNPELRSFAQKTLPVIERHIDQLHTIAPTAMRTGS